jgi:Flp pilus assembly protein TadG
VSTDRPSETRLQALRRRFRFDRRAARQHDRQLGQVLPIFAIMSVVLLGAAAIATDVAWWWTNEQRMQRAADAAALAGAPYLPGDQSQAFAAARAEATKNGYTSGVGGVTVTPRRDTVGGNTRKLIVDVDGPVTTHFARVFGMVNVDVGVTGAAEMVLPVPMGSPQNYYGVGFFRDEVTTVVPTPRTGTTLTRAPTGFLSTAPDNDWSNPGGAFGPGTTSEGANNDTQAWNGFDLSSLPPTFTITAIRVLLGDVVLDGSGSACRITAHLSWDGGTSWTGPQQTNQLSTSGADEQIPPTGSSTWGRSWSRSDFVGAGGQPSPFRVRLTWNDGFTDCPSSRDVDVSDLDVQLTYNWTENVTTTIIQETDVRAPDGPGTILAPQNFWGALQSQGAPNIQGDAYMTYYDTRTSQTNPDYSPTGYYHYSIEFAPGTSGREIWVFDPGFCDVSSSNGTGEYYTFGSPNGSGNTFNRVSTYYDLYDTKETPWDLADDGTPVASFGNDYVGLRLRDTVLQTSGSSNFNGTSPCNDLTWHNGWVRLNGDLTGGNKFRLHTHSTNPGSPSDQQSTTALNAFAIWATSSGTAPKVHGLGAMEAYVRLPGGRASQFYLAQIDAEHAGKTMVINLWDPGDTGALRATLKILKPTSSTYQAVPFTFTARRNSGASTNCTNETQATDDDSDNTTVVTNNGGTSRYNGCWVTIEIVIPDDYTAPHPSSDTVTTQGGWWKILYDMGGSSSDYSTDLTTWQVELRGNPVHLVPE